MTLATEGKAVCRSGSFVDMIVNGVCATATNVILRSCPDPVVDTPDETRARRWVAMTGIASATFERAIYMEGFVDEDVGVAVAGRINIAMAAAGGTNRCGRWESGRQNNGGMAI